jgi:photosystem II stability/assembly factor-like uncharacterized protein
MISNGASAGSADSSKLQPVEPLRGSLMLLFLALQVALRGVSVAPDGTVWASGQHGVVMHTTDAGTSWQVDTIAAARTFDLRGIAGVDRLTAHAMVAGADTARIFVTTDGGHTWKLEYDNTRRGMFLDALALWSARDLIALGDPIGNQFTVLVSRDAGAHWQQVATPPTLPGEAAFAASNTCLTTGPNGQAWFVTGGAHTVGRVFHTSDYGMHWSVADLPLPAGDASSGAFSIAFSGRHGVVVGGDYAVPDSSRPNVALTEDGGATWLPGPPAGAVPYLSAVAPFKDGWLATGTQGTWFSRDGGRAFTRIGDAPYNGIAVSNNNAILLGAKIERIGYPTR